ncbi:MAG: hypothetical protein IJJ74_06340 [Eubacterium sp.]|nr:hypothetical protein [Eubacterium sp.]
MACYRSFGANEAPTATVLEPLADQEQSMAFIDIFTDYSCTMIRRKMRFLAWM